MSTKINFVSSKDYSNETRTLSNWSDNREIVRGNKTDDIIDKLLKPFLQRYQEKLEKSMKEKEFFLIGLIYCIIIFIK